jgi:hypothetical protein
MLVAIFDEGTVGDTKGMFLVVKVELLVRKSF